MTSADPEEIRRALNTLHDADEVIELRALHIKGRGRTDAGYFDAEHRDQLIDAAVKLNGRAAAVYVVMNPIDQQMLARHANRVQEYAKATATDINVIARRWLLIDIDPQRPKDTSATQEQLAAAVQCGLRIVDELLSQNWPQPVIVESGNGLHLYYRIALPNDAAAADLIKRCLEALAARFDTDTVKIDRSVFNAARIVKLPGTVANKGDDLPETPWRLSKLTSVPSELRIVVRELLNQLASEAKTNTPPNGHDKASPQSWTEQGVTDFLRRGNIEVLGPPAMHEGSLRWQLKCCPFNNDHGPKDAAVFLKPDGRLGFHCLHNSCADKRWADLRELVDGPREKRGRTKPAPEPPREVPELCVDPPAPFTEVYATSEAPPVALVTGLLFPGAWLLMGRPKIGKSWLLLQLALAIAEGGTFLGFNCIGADVLAFFAEDTYRRISDRLKKLGVARPPPNAFMYNREDVLRQAQRYAEHYNFIQFLEKQLDAMPKVKLVLVDTEMVVRQVWSGEGSAARVTETDYKQTRVFDEIALRRGIVIILVNHAKKRDGEWYDIHELINRSNTALAGASGSIAIADPPDADPLDPTQRTRVLGVRGRDLSEDVMLAVHQEKEPPVFIADGAYLDVRQSQGQAELLDALEELMPEIEAGKYVTAQDLADHVGKTRVSVKRMMSRLKKAGRTSWKQYRITIKAGKSGGYRLDLNLTVVK